MAVTKRAKVLDNELFAKLLMDLSQEPHGLRKEVMLLLSYKAGLRAKEIAGLDWTDVTTADGKVRSDQFFVPGDVAKYGHARDLPMHPMLYISLMKLRLLRPRDVGIIYGDTTRRMTPNAVSVWFHRIYDRYGFEGCSSHSGRRTFITNLSRTANDHGCSLRDVQFLAGHRTLATTEKYIELSTQARRMVNAI